MGLFRFGSSKTQSGDYFSTAIFSGTRSYTVSEIQAMQIPAVKSCVELITSTISQLPIYLYTELENGDLEEVNDARVSLLNDAANKRDTAAKVKKLLVKDLLFYGKAYLFKKDNELHYLEASKMTADSFTNDGITISRRQFTYNGMRTVTLDENEVIVFETGTEGILVDGENILQQAQNELEYSKNVMSNGALPVGVLQVASRLTENAITRLKESFSNLYGSAKNAGKTLILEEGMAYKAVSLNPNELQLNETNKHTIASICRLFNVPQALVDSNANKYASLEMQNMQFLQFTVSPLINTIESTLNQTFLEDFELEGGRYFRFDTSEVLRVTEKELVDTTISLVKSGLISVNEARAKLDRKRINTDYFVLTLGNALKDAETDKITIINLGQTIELGGSTNNENGAKKQQDNTSI
ncbi:phage portal protein [Bacillus cihuensis]|uniref:phage portal protein n=1 Tax=Bacillus cihuensis TaxID=1208599 RepID=UPI0003F73B82|nr:phage portal protein [Bacillus cihuensis]